MNHPAPIEITAVEPRGGTRLHLRFTDGSSGELDLAEVITFDGVFAPLQDQAFFDQVRVDPTWGIITWPGALDLAPEPLHALIQKLQADPPS